MQFITAKPLIEKYRRGTFQEDEVAPYFMAYVILTAIVVEFTFGDMNGWAVASGFASIVINIMGVLHLKRQNNDSFGNNFLSKYFSLGWVISFRMLLISIPSAVVIFALASIVGGDDASGPAGALFDIAYSVLFYWWLGLLFAESNTHRSEQDAPSNR